MGAVCNGMALCGLRAYGATFFVFTDLHAAVDPPGRHHGPAGRSTSSRTTRSAWARTAPRTSRSSTWPRCGRFPTLIVLRPADANEVAEAYRVIMPLTAPAGGAGAHAAEPAHARPHEVRPGRRRRTAAATCWPTPPDGKPEVILIGTGSEVRCASTAYEKLTAEGIKARVVSMPSLGTVRRPAAGVPRRGAAADGHAPGSAVELGSHVRLGPLRRPDRARSSA